MIIPFAYACNISFLPVSASPINTIFAESAGACAGGASSSTDDIGGCNDVVANVGARDSGDCDVDCGCRRTSVAAGEEGDGDDSGDVVVGSSATTTVV